MKNKTWFFVFQLILIAVLASGCKSETPPAQVDGASGGDKSAAESGSDDENGSASISYKWIFNQPPILVSVIQVDIPVIIRSDPDNEGSWMVQGASQGTAYLQLAGMDQGNMCFVQCDVLGSFIADGELTFDKDNPDCKIPIKFSSLYDFENAKTYGDCPDIINKKQICENHIKYLIDDHTYTFTNKKRDVTQDTDEEVTLSASIRNVIMPSKTNTICTWAP